MTWKAGDKILYHGVTEVTLIKPMTPYGVRNASTKTEGQCWEMKFPDLPCTVYRWLYPAVDSVTVEAKHMSPEMPDANISAELGSGDRSRRNSDGSLDNSCVEKEKGGNE